MVLAAGLSCSRIHSFHLYFQLYHKRREFAGAGECNSGGCNYTVENKRKSIIYVDHKVYEYSEFIISNLNLFQMYIWFSQLGVFKSLVSRIREPSTRNGPCRALWAVSWILKKKKK